MRIVTFHTPVPTWQNTPHVLGGIKPVCRDLIPLFIESVRHTNPTASLELITDKDSLIYEEFDIVHRFDIAQDQLMLDRLSSQLLIVSQSNCGEEICFLDTDVLVLTELTPIFDGSFDVSITIRDEPKEHFEFTMPYNNGVVFVSCEFKDRSASFLQRVYDANVSMDPDAYAWSGNQFAVRDLVGNRRPYEVVTLGDARIKILPCSRYNYTPSGKGESVNDRRILHFRGDAKTLMKDYAISEYRV